MSDELDIATWMISLEQELADVWSRLVPLLVGLTVCLAVVALGWGLAHLAELVTARVLRAGGVDRMVARLVPRAVVEAAGRPPAPSRTLSKLVFWAVFLAFGLIGLEALGVSVVALILDQLTVYGPGLLRSLLVLVLGGLGVRMVGGLVSSVAAAGGVPDATRLATVAQILVGALVLALAAEQLGVAASLLVIPATALVVTVAFTIGLTLALGARPIVTHILAGHFLRRSLPRDVFVEVNGQRGVVERVGATETVLRGENRTWSVPNGRLIDEIVVR